MNRKLQVLGLALFALVATAAVMASAAQATPEFTCGKYPCVVEWTGENVGEKLLIENGNGLFCKVTHYTGTLSESASTLTVQPTYTECEAFGLSSTVNTEECHYLYHATEKVTEHLYKAHTDITCPAGQSIKINAGFGVCQAEVKEQKNLTTVDIENMTNTPEGIHDLTITPTLTGPATEMDGKHGPIAYTVTKDGFGCPLNGTGNKTGGEYSTEKPITIIATEDVEGQGNGTQVSLTVSGE